MDYSSKPLFTLTHSTFPVDWSDMFGRSAPLNVEIGFGLGEVLIRMAKKQPEENFIGIEQHWDRIFKSLRKIVLEKKNGAKGISSAAFLENIKILKIDARVALEWLFPEKSIDHVYCLFPCPWPKKKHVKNRLFSHAFFKLLNNRLKDKGRGTIVSDFGPYIDWVLEQVEGSGFKVTRDIIQPQFDTKFERKWCTEGKKEFFEINLFKQQHRAVPLKEKSTLKSYHLKSFEPENFDFKNMKGDVSVIFKEKLYDPQQEKMMVHLIVAEPDLTQHLWVTITKEGHGWRVERSEGQEFFPTPAIDQALRSVYDHAVLAKE